MEFDPSSGKIILFADHGTAGYLNDTWAYESASNTWTELTPATSPPARNGSTMAFDPCSGQIILFDGYSNNTGGNLLDDTWGLRYNHTSDTYTWTQLLPANQPSGRYGSILKFNPSSGQLILFGGGYLTSTSNDTWVYDGKANTWTELYPINPPESREFSGFDFNPISGQMILIGGVNLSSDTVVSGTEALRIGLLPQITSANEATFEVYELTFTANNGLSAGLSQNFTLVILPVLPPRNFIGEIKEFSDNPKSILKATWDASLSQNIVHYLLYKNGILVDTILANSQLVFVTCVESVNTATMYQIVAIN